MSVDFAAVTGRQQMVWSLGDYGRVGSLLSWLGECLVEHLDIHSGERVLDVAAGNGNAALPAARRFADVLATDYVPDLLAEAGRSGPGGGRSRDAARVPQWRPDRHGQPDESGNTTDDGTLALDVAYLEVIGVRA